MYLARGIFVLAMSLSWSVAAQSDTAAPLLPKPPESTAMRGLVLALQQVGVAAEQYVNDMNQRLAARDAQIAELLKKCGEACGATPKVSENK